MVLNLPYERSVSILEEPTFKSNLFHDSEKRGEIWVLPVRVDPMPFRTPV